MQHAGRLLEGKIEIQGGPALVIAAPGARETGVGVSAKSAPEGVPHGLIQKRHIDAPLDPEEFGAQDDARMRVDLQADPRP
jgi:hypothetical protein